MNDLAQDLNNVWAALLGVAKPEGAKIMFMGLRSGDGTSFCARNFAQLCEARAAKAVWLLDLDFFNDGQFREFSKAGVKFSGPFDMTFNARPFWNLTPFSRDINIGEILVGARIDNSKLFVSRFRREKMAQGQSMQIAPTPEYWQNFHNSIDFCVVDAPAVEDSRAGFALVPDMDGVVLVIDPNNGHPDEAMQLRDEIHARGGVCLGAIVVNNSTMKA